MGKTLMLGAVAYDPKVVRIWDGFQDWFHEHGLSFDYTLYSNYEAQVRAHLAGHIDVAWNSPLAWLLTERAAVSGTRTARALAMRHTDCDLTSLIVVGSNSDLRSLADLRGKIVGVGAADSPQATLIPLLTIAEAGLVPGRDLHVQRFDVLLGKHGDHIGGERDAARALVRGAIDAACMIDSNHLLFSREGVMPPGSTRILTQTESYDHCNMTVLDGAPSEETAQLTELLLSMSYDDPAVRPLLDLEGLTRWLPGRTEKYAVLARALDRFESDPAALGGSFDNRRAR